MGELCSPLRSGPSDKRDEDDGFSSKLLDYHSQDDRGFTAALSQDGRTIMTGSGGGRIRIWDVSTRQEVDRLGKPIVGIFSPGIRAVFSPNSVHVAFTDNNVLRVWRVATGKEEWASEALHDRSMLTCLAFSSDTKRIASGSWDESVQIWEVPIAQEEHLSVPPSEEASASLTALQEAFLASAVIDNRAQSRRSAQASRASRPAMHDSQALAFSTDSTCFAWASEDFTIRVSSILTGTEIREPLMGHENHINSITFSCDGQHIASGSEDKTIRIWEASTGKEVCNPLMGHTASVCSVSFSPNSARIVSGSDDQSIRIWDVTTGEEACKPILGHTDSVTCVMFSPDAAWILSAAEDDTIRVWDAATGTQIRELPRDRHDGNSSLAISPNSKYIVSVPYNTHNSRGAIRIWDAVSGAQTCELSQGLGNVWCVAFFPDSKHILTAFGDRSLHILDVETLKDVVQPLTGHKEWVRSVAISPDGAHIISGSQDGVIRIWKTLFLSAIGGQADLLLEPVVSGVTPPASIDFYRPCDHWGTYHGSGWIVDEAGNNLFWVPEEFRKSFCCSRTANIIGATPCRVDMSRFVHGNEWTKCYAGGL